MQPLLPCYHFMWEQWAFRVSFHVTLALSFYVTSAIVLSRLGYCFRLSFLVNLFLIASADKAERSSVGAGSVDLDSLPPDRETELQIYLNGRSDAYRQSIVSAGTGGDEIDDDEAARTVRNTISGRAHFSLHRRHLELLEDCKELPNAWHEVSGCGFRTKDLETLSLRDEVSIYTNHEEPSVPVQQERVILRIGRCCLTSYRCKKHLLSRGCVAEIVRRRDIPLTTVSDRDARLYLDAWRSFQLDLGMRVTITTANGLHSDGQSSWGNHLPVEASRMRSTCHVTNLMACFAESELRAKLSFLVNLFLIASADKAERSSVGAGSVDLDSLPPDRETELQIYLNGRSDAYRQSIVSAGTGGDEIDDDEAARTVSIDDILNYSRTAEELPNAWHEVSGCGFRTKDLETLSLRDEVSIYTNHEEPSVPVQQERVILRIGRCCLTSYRCKKHLLSRGCVAEIVRRRDIPLTTVSDRDARLYLDAWRSFQLDLGMRVTITTANGLHSDGQSSWGNHLPVEASRMRSTCHVTNLMACFAESELRAKLSFLVNLFLIASADKAERSSVGAGSVDLDSLPPDRETELQIYLNGRSDAYRQSIVSAGTGGDEIDDDEAARTVSIDDILNYSRTAEELPNAWHEVSGCGFRTKDLETLSLRDEVSIYTNHEEPSVPVQQERVILRIGRCCGRQEETLDEQHLESERMVGVLGTLGVGIKGVVLFWKAVMTSKACGYTSEDSEECARKPKYSLTSYRCKKHLLSRGCVAEIVRRRDIPLTTVSDRDARLYLDAWRSFQLDLGMRVTITTANGLHSDGQKVLGVIIYRLRRVECAVRIRQSVAQLGQDQVPLGRLKGRAWLEAPIDSMAQECELSQGSEHQDGVSTLFLYHMIDIVGVLWVPSGQSDTRNIMDLETLLLGIRIFGDNVKPRCVGYNYGGIWAHIITIILYMLGLGEVIKGIYEPTRLGRIKCLCLVEFVGEFVNRDTNSEVKTEFVSMGENLVENSLAYPCLVVLRETSRLVSSCSLRSRRTRAQHSLDSCGRGCILHQRLFRGREGSLLVKPAKDDDNVRWDLRVRSWMEKQVARLFIYVANEKLVTYCRGDPKAELREFCEGTVESPLEVEWRTRVPLRIDETTEAVFDDENKRICSLLRSQLLAFVSDSWVMFYDENIFRCLCRQMGFELYLIPGATLVGKVPFCLAPPERMKDGLMRLCIENRELNNLTVKNRYPLPRIDDLFDQLLGTVWSPKIDLPSGYHEVVVTGEDVQKTASKSRCGCFEFVVLMFELANAPAMFMDHMNRVCGPKLDGSRRCERRDCIPSSPSVTLGYKMAQFLEHFVNREGIKVKSDKSGSSNKGEASETPIEIWSFLGLAGYYRRFIQDFSKMVVPLTRLMRKSVMLLGGGEQLEALVVLWKRLCEAPVLSLPEGSIRSRQNLSMSQRRWLDLVKDYDCEILYHPGKANLVVITLSRKAHSVVMRVPLMRLTVMTSMLELTKSSQVDLCELGSTERVQKTMEGMEMIREWLRTAQSHQKSYTDKRRSNLEFNVGDGVLLKISPWKGKHQLSFMLEIDTGIEIFGPWNEIPSKSRFLGSRDASRREGEVLAPRSVGPRTAKEGLAPRNTAAHCCEASRREAWVLNCERVWCVDTLIIVKRTKVPLGRLKGRAWLEAPIDSMAQAYPSVEFSFVNYFKNNRHINITTTQF
ncbi:hypothetical protein OSB04_un000020 [Centaurea solstitialis]|uniref:Reverse transcriptase domain-containing protein n=1 Tax=Centaurea solstitialis TaxID=347529 RepID=A0AA38W6A4_9ASTR|nr:hypothetical protein OSB04_un000020 [Centaurea solstitialis]